MTFLGTKKYRLSSFQFVTLHVLNIIMYMIGKAETIIPLGLSWVLASIFGLIQNKFVVVFVSQFNETCSYFKLPFFLNKNCS